MTADAWFTGLSVADTDAAAERVREGRADEPQDWPALAVEDGFAAETDAYYEALKAATTAAARAESEERERAADRQLVHAVRAMDDCREQANELAERVSEWAGTRDPEAGTGLEYARELAERDPDSPADERVQTLARRAIDLADEATALRSYVEATAPEVAPNLSNLAGPVLAARLVSLAGGLDALAKKPSGTLQVLGAEDALFAHLKGSAPSPKHGVIYTHEAIQGTRPADRGSAARALAGKLTIAARVDRYSGDLRPELEAELTDRLDTIRAREGPDE